MASTIDFIYGKYGINATPDNKNVRIFTNSPTVEQKEVQLARGNVQFRVSFHMDQKHLKLLIIHPQAQVLISQVPDTATLNSLRALFAAFW